uniref:Histone-lysine N-methyltransferase SETMAR n=1 Tax=Heterorhabditis bacteriophora TaxID=37862 RepID=A0A1I7X3P6_HETBA
MATVGWSASGVIHYNFLCPGETTTAEKYCHEIDKMLQELQLYVQPILLHDNVRPHVSQMILQKLERTGLRDSTVASLLTRPLSDQQPLSQSARQLPAKEGSQQRSSSSKRLRRIHRFQNSRILCYRNK